MRVLPYSRSYTSSVSLRLTASPRGEAFDAPKVLAVTRYYGCGGMSCGQGTADRGTVLCPAVENERIAENQVSGTQDTEPSPVLRLHSALAGLLLFFLA